MDNNLTKAKEKKPVLYAILLAIVSLVVLIGPIVYIILGTYQKEGVKGNPLEKQYIISVCIGTLIVCGISLILILSSIIYKKFHKNNL